MLAPAKERLRSVEVIPALLVMMLNDLGKLPEIPNLPDGSSFGFRKPTLEDMQSLTWVAYWEGKKTDMDGFRKVSGLAAFRDLYDWHSASDVRELVSIRGSKRACTLLTKWILADGLAHNRRLVGAIQIAGDWKLSRFMNNLGGRVTRWWTEYDVESNG